MVLFAQVAREKNWKMLEDKGDLDLLLMQVKDMCRKHTEAHAHVASWQSSLGEIVKLERRVSEQYTVVCVYRSALDKDSNQVLKVWVAA
jgi:hypothetical protein